jgi:hypothetical protein
MSDVARSGNTYIFVYKNMVEKVHDIKWLLLEQIMKNYIYSGFRVLFGLR